jgi:amino acid adenylation domain-containing protein
MDGTSDSDARALTSAQLAIWTGQTLQPDDPLYNMVLSFRIRGALNAGAFQSAFKGLVEACDALRTVIDVVDGMPRQRVLAGGYGLPLVDLSGSRDPEIALEDWLAEHRARAFDLSHGHCESALLRLADDDHLWYLNQHHILTDASSVAILFNKQQALYRQACEATPGDVAALPAFADYVRFAAAQADSPQHRKARAYWSGQLARPSAPSRFYQKSTPCLRGRTQRVEVPLGEERSRRLRELSGQVPFRAFTGELALFQIFATVLFACVARTTGNSMPSLGVPSHNRGSARFRQTAGLLIEILPITVSIDADDSFLTLYRKVAQVTGQMLRNALPGISSVRQHQAFDLVLNFITASFGDFDGLPTQTRWLHPGYGDRNHVLRVQVENFECQQALKVFFDMNVEMFGEREQRCLVRHFLALADAMISDPAQAVAGVDLVADVEREQLLAGHRHGAIAQRPVADVMSMFEQQVAQTPDALAVSSRGRQIDYRELDLRATALADELAARAIGPGAIVGVLLGRSIEAVVALLGILRCGAAFLPLDPDYPSSRLVYMCVDAKVVLLLADRAAPELEGIAPLMTFSCDEPVPDFAAGHKSSARGGDLAYVIYTSGSSGEPKGVMIERHSMANYLRWAGEQYLDSTRPQAFAFFSSLSFDLTLTSVFLPLLSGGSLVVYPASADGSDAAVLQVVADNRVDILKLTPAHLALMQSVDLSQSRIHTMILGGEDLRTDLARATVRRYTGKLRIFNEYGPTEATVGCMTHLFDPDLDSELSVPIGRAIEGLDVYVLDRDRQLLPAGVSGEIHIAGAGLARGYLGQAERTAEKFVDNPFVPGTRMYASGDVAAWNVRNELVYLGRVDRQVKIRGVRVEPGEIERQLSEHEAITDCAVEAFSHASRPGDADEAHCAVCGLTSQHPEAHLDAQGVCRICRLYAEHRAQAQAYFGNDNELLEIARRARGSATGKHDCIMLLSGGKDSTYALCQLVDLGLRPLVFTLDNGFISAGAMSNVRRVVADLQLELVVGETLAMNAIFQDSLRRFSNVCNGCFKTIYTLSTHLARERGIRFVFTGLSRGQIFETRVAGLFQQRVFDRALIDRAVLQARKAYHRMDDAVAQHLDVRAFADDAVFDEVEFVDFYRYREVTLDTILDYLERKIAWVRPVDTGRSTNCRINEVGIHVHKLERGFHNYALPYSWDIRLGHKERNSALAELDDRIDMANVAHVLKQIDYTLDTPAVGRGDQYLVAYYVSAQPLPSQLLRDYLAARVPSALVPSQFVHLERMPLTANGKIDRRALPMPDGTRPALSSAYLAPRNETESLLARIWQEILGLDRVGVHDNFFDLGGDSIHSIQIVARARANKLSLTPQQLFAAPTVADLAQASTRVPTHLADQTAPVGPLPLLPGQYALLRQTADPAVHYALLELPDPPEPEALARALLQLIGHHDGLRTRLRSEQGRWLPEIVPVAAAPVDLHEWQLNAADSLEASIAALLVASPIAIGMAPMLRAAWSRRGQGGLLILMVHALVIDSVSWGVLLEDLAHCYAAARKRQTADLPTKTTSLRHWSQALWRYADSALARERARRWLDPRARTTGSMGAAPARLIWKQVDSTLEASATAHLLHDVPGGSWTLLPELLLTAVLRATRAHAGARHRRVEIEGHGRAALFAGIDLTRTVGHLAVLFPLRFRHAPDGEAGSDLREVQRAWRELPAGGLDFALARDGEADAALGREVTAAALGGVSFPLSRPDGPGPGDP